LDFPIILTVEGASCIHQGVVKATMEAAQKPETSYPLDGTKLHQNSAHIQTHIDKLDAHALRVNTYPVVHISK
jgi:hypothetical protein